MKALREFLDKSSSVVVLLSENLVDKIWQNRPSPSKKYLSLHAKYAGESSISKLEKVRTTIQSNNASVYVVHELSEIAWTLNLRGKDIPFSPVFEAYLLITLDIVTLFLDRDKITGEVGAYLRDEVKADVEPYEGIWQALKEMSNAKRTASGYVIISYVSCRSDDFFCSVS